MPCTARASAFGAEDFHLPNPERHYAPDLGLEPIHLDIALGFDLAGKQAAGAVTISFEGRRSDARSTKLDAVDLREVEVVDADGFGLDWSYDGEHLEITWREAPGTGGVRRAEIRYRVIAPLTGMEFSWPDERHPDRPKFLCTDHETERARYWLPCIDHPTVRTPVDFHLRAGAEYTVLANGLRVGQDLHDDDTKTVHWKLEEVCPSYLICLAVGEFVRADGGHLGDVEIAAFGVAPYTAEDLERSFDPTRSMLEWMTAKLDSPFPFPKYFQLAVPGIGGAMENISLVTWDDKFVADALFRAERGWLIDLINVHEMAHSWFGDAIVVRDYAHVWLKESWATYIESCWLEDTEGIDEMHWQLSEEARAYRNEADKRYVRPIVTRDFDSSWDMYDGHLYPGGAFRLHVLREELGDEDFWAGVRDYVKLFSGRVVETSDFRRTLEARSGHSLAKFFDQWFHRPGYPRLEAAFRYSRARSEVSVTIEQSQVDDARGIGLFEFTIEIDIERADGEWITSELDVSDDKHTLIVPVDERPLQVVIDPRGKVLHSMKWSPGKDLLERALTSAPTVPGRIQAARALGRSGSPRSCTALKKAFGTEPHWGVRIEIARALGDAGTRAAAAVLCGLLPTEQDPRVMADVAQACGKYREATVARAVTEWLSRSDLPYLARRAGLQALGKQRGEDHLDTLRAAAVDRGWWGWVRQGAMTALGATRSEEARRALMGRVDYGTDAVHVRTAAVAALAEAGRYQKEGPRQQTLEKLSDLVRDPDYAVRQAAVRGLRAFGDAAGVPAMEAATKSLAGQDAPRVRRMIAELKRRFDQGGEARRLGKQVEDLGQRVRKLQHRIATLEARHRSDEPDDSDEAIQSL